jgi:hypothetical protein
MIREPNMNDVDLSEAVTLFLKRYPGRTTNNLTQNMVKRLKTPDLQFGLS